MKCEGLDKVVIGDDPERFFQVGAQLPLEEKEELVELLRRNVDVFVWDAYEAPGLDPKFICHHLNVNPSVTPKRQPPRRPSNEHVEAVKSEVTKLKQAGAIKEVFYPQWLANTMVVKKKTGKWHVCVDFTDLNKACPKDPFPLPRIDQLVDATVGHPQMSFLDAFKVIIRYHWQQTIRKKQLSSLLWGTITIKWCLLAWKTQGQPINGWWQKCLNRS